MGNSTASIGTKNLDRVLGKKDFFAMAIGQIIGAGIFSLLPQAIGLTGRSATLAFLLAACLTLLLLAPRLFVLGTVRLRGGRYTYVALMSSKKLAGAYLVIYLLNNISLSMYALSIGEYFAQLVPGINVRLIAVFVLTVFAVVNLMGIKKAVVVQQILVLCLAAALSVFTAFGLFHVDYTAFVQTEGFMSNGIMGFCSAAALLTFATGGAQNIIDLSAEAKNPTKDIPVVIIVATIGIALFYVFMSTVATGVLPVEMVAGKPLSVVAAQILPGPLYVFFMVGGAMFALVTTLNSQMATCTKPLLQGCADGWLPKKLGEVNQKFKTPHYLILIFYVIGLLPLVFSFDMNSISATAVFSSSIIDILMASCVFRLPKVLPNEWGLSSWHTSQRVLWFWTIAGTLASVFTAYMSLRTTSLPMMILNIVVCVIALVFGFWRDRSGKVDMEISYEAQ